MEFGRWEAVDSRKPKGRRRFRAAAAGSAVEVAAVELQRAGGEGWTMSPAAALANRRGRSGQADGRVWLPTVSSGAFGADSWAAAKGQEVGSDGWRAS